VTEPFERELRASPVDSAEFVPSFVDLYHECLTPMVRLAWALTGLEATAEDVVHDAFIRVHARWARIDAPRAYLRQAVVNGCRTASRRSRRELPVESVQLIEVSRLDADDLFDALGDLPYRQRAALVLHFYEGLPHSEIAQLLHCREGTVASLVHRGLEQLRRVIDR